MPLFFGECGDEAAAPVERQGRCLSVWDLYLPHVKIPLYSDSDSCFFQARTKVAAQYVGESQLLQYGSRNFVLMLDGWIANRIELSKQLFPSAVASSISDTSLLAEALLRWGDDALLRLHGDFVFTWWNKAKKRLLLACDRTGGRTLFYHNNGSHIIFSNLLESLFAQPDIPKEIDLEKVVLNTFSLIYDLKKTCFKGIGQLPPAHKLVWTPQSCQIECYWRIDPHRKITYSSDEDYVEAGREILDRVVKEASQVNGPLLCCLSGGLDSSAVAATAARLYPDKTIHTVTWRPDDSATLPLVSKSLFYDEWAHALAVASFHPNITSHQTQAQLGSIESELLGNLSLTGRSPVAPLATLWFSGTWKIAQQLGAKVVIDAGAGNATLSTQPFPLFPCTRWQDIPDALSDLWFRICCEPTPKGVLRAGRFVLSPLKNEVLEFLKMRLPFFRAVSPLRKEIVEQAGIENLWQQVTVGNPDIPWRLRSRLWLLERTWQARAWTSPLRWKRGGVESRDPLSDVRLAEFCMAIPFEQFARPGMNRALARRVLADRLPPMVLNETRKGRQNPEWFDWMTRSRPWLEEQVARIESSSLGSQLLDVPRFKEILANWPQGQLSPKDAAKHYSSIMGSLGTGVALGLYLRWAEGENQ